MMQKLTITCFAVTLSLIMAKTAYAHDTTPSASSKADQILIAYLAPKDRDLVNVYKDMKARHVLERAQEFLSPFKLPEPIKFTFQDCGGEDDASYDAQEVTLCYEYVDELQWAKPKRTTRDGVTPHDAVAGPFFSTLLHEFVHAMFDVLDVPVLGREEDAADQLAAFIILQLGKVDASRLIRGTAYAFKTESKEKKSKSSLEFAGEHGTPEQRYYNVLCVAYGADPKFFADLKSKRILPSDRLEQCQDEYEQAEDAYKATILPYIDEGLANKVWSRLEIRNK